MKSYKMNYWAIFSFLVVACSTPVKREASKLGSVDFDITGSKEAKPFFLEGYLLMHSFEFSDAAEAFREAQRVDTTCAMAYWGEAMTYHHAIWQEQDFEAGKKVLEKLGETAEVRIEKAASPLEKDLLRAAHVLYGKGSKPERDKAYADFMATLHAKYPGNHEVASLYALSLLGSVAVGRDDEVYQKSARVSESILKENPNHPGALHYFIHANDDPSHAEKALFAANEYAVVAPDAAHALHMPTHIYVAMGMWDDVVSSNEASWKASVARKQRKGLSNNALSYHSFHWLQYGYLQQAREDDARKLLTDMIRYCEELPSTKARAHEIYLKSTYLIATDDWESMFALHSTDVQGLNVAVRGQQSFVRGMKFYHDGAIDSLEKTIDKMRLDRMQESTTLSEAGIALCQSGGASRDNATKLDIDVVHVMELELQGLKEWKLNNLDAAEKLFREATIVEQRSSYSYGPPSVVKPSFELYGEFLLSVNRPEDALVAFNTALQRAPKRVLSLKGKLAAANLSKNESETLDAEKQLQEI